MLRITVHRPINSFSIPIRIVGGTVILGIVGIFSVIVATGLGPYDVSIRSTVGFFIGLTGINTIEVPDTHRAIIENIRIPRISMALLVGGGLSSAGVIMQGVFRNNMADPGIIGVSAGGAVGAVIAISTGAALYSIWAIPGFAFVGSLVAMTLVFLIASSGGGVSVPTLLLAGIAIGAFLNSIISAVVLFSGDIDAQRQMMFWLAGGFDSTRWDTVRLVAPLIIIPVLVSSFFARDLNLILVGEDQAQALGIRVGLVRNFLLIVASIVTSVAVAYTGIIAFVGLVVPHVVRIILGPDHRVLLPLAFLTGSIFMLIADTLARTLVSPAELRVGMVTALAGAPFFIFLLIKRRQQIFSL